MKTIPAATYHRDLELAEKALEEMRGGPILDVSPDRARNIIAQLLADERERLAERVEAMTDAFNAPEIAKMIRRAGIES